jgi:hypothetical protein
MNIAFVVSTQRKLENITRRWWFYLLLLSPMFIRTYASKGYDVCQSLDVIMEALANPLIFKFPALFPNEAGLASTDRAPVELGHSRVLGALLAAIIVGGLAGRWRRLWGLIVLWVLGLASLAFFILWLPLASYLERGVFQ